MRPHNRFSGTGDVLGINQSMSHQVLYRCDRCRKEGTGNIFFNVDLLQPVCLVDVVDARSGKFDLCPFCADAFVQFMKGKEEVRDTSTVFNKPI